MLTTKEKKYSNAHKTKTIDKKGNVAFLKFDKQTWLQFKDMMTGSNDAEINKRMKLFKDSVEEQKKKDKKKKSD